MMRYPKVETRTKGRRIVDAVLIDTLFLLLGFFLAVILASYYPLPWYIIP